MMSLCRVLDWDTAFFGARIARVNAGRVAPDAYPAILDWCAQDRVECLYLLADPNDSPTGRGAEENGFHLTDIRVTFERKLDDVAQPLRSMGEESYSRIRLVQEGDIPALVAIARVSHTDSRFYHDPGFSRERCDELYGVWLDKSCRGGASAVFVAESNHLPVGYITCQVDGDTGSVGLIGLAAEARGAGLGAQLVQQALAWFGSENMRRVTVVTQGRNATAQRLYQRAGFLHQSIELWYHRWF